MLGFSPLAGAPLGGDEDQAVVGDAFQPRNVTTGAPVVATVALSSTHDVAGDDIVTAAPVVASVGLSLVHDLTAVNIATAAPVIGTPSVDVFSLLAPDAIVTGAPVLALPALSTIHNFTAAGVITGAPVVASVDMSSQQDLSAVGIVTAAPVLGTPLAEEAQPFPVNGIVTGAPVIGGISYAAGSFDGFIHAIQTGDEPESTFDAYWFSDDGTKYYRNGLGTAFGPTRFALSTPFDVSTATLVSSGTRVSSTNTTLRILEFQLSSDGTKFYALTRETTGTAEFPKYKFSFNTYGLSPAFNTAGTYSLQSSVFLSEVSFSQLPADQIDHAILAGGSIYTIQFRSDFTRDLQRRTTAGTLLNEVQLINDGSEPRTAPLVLDGNLRLYVAGDIYANDLTLLDTSSAILQPDALGSSANYLVRPDGFAILTPTLLEFDGNPQPVTIQQFGAIGAVSIATGQPSLEQGDLDQQHTFAPVAVLTGPPVIAATAATQDIDVAANDIVTGQPVVPDGSIGQVHQMGAGSIITGQPVLQSTNTFGSGALFAVGIIAGAPDLGLLSLSQEQQVVVDPITAGQPSLQNADMVQGITLAAVNINAAPPSLDLTSISQDHEFALDGVASEPPSLGQTTVTQGQFTALRITAGNPVLGLLTMQREQALSADGITTGPPALVTLLINGSARRIVDQSASSNNNVAVTTGSNIAIVSERYSKSA